MEMKTSREDVTENLNVYKVHSNAFIKKNDDDTKKGSPLILKQKEVSNKLANEKKRENIKLQ